MSEVGGPEAAPGRRLARDEARLERLRKRHRILRALRAWLDERGFVEVNPPLLARGTCPDVGIRSFAVPGAGWLVTSTEYHLKRLCAAGLDRVYSLTQNFRAGDLGPHHNPEFTMLEWARVGAPLGEIEADLEALVAAAAAAAGVAGWPTPWERLSVAEVLERHLGAPLPDVGLETLRRLAPEAPASMSGDARDLLSWLLAEAQPSLGRGRPTWVVDWPAALTASAPPLPGRPGLACRAELFVDGLELADGFPTLTDAALQERLFAEEVQARRALGLPPVDLDARFLETLRGGLPPGAGMALGVDRLVMALLGAPDLGSVLAFAWGDR